jgi:hypothetical protein
MPIYKMSAPNGRVYSVEGPEGASDADIARAIIGLYPESTQPPPPEPTFGGYVREAAKGVPAGAVGLLESAATGIATLLPEEQERSVRESITRMGAAARAPFAPQPGYEETIPRKLSEAVGSTVPFLALGPFGMAGRAGMLGLGMGAGSGEAVTRAEQAGATPEQVSTATGLGAVVGTTEALPIFRILNRLGTPVASGILNRIRRIAASAGEEAAQEAAASIAQNLIEQGIYNPQQEVLEGIGEAAGYGAGTGAIVQALLDAALGRRARPAAPPTPPPTVAEERTAQERTIAEQKASRDALYAAPLDDKTTAELQELRDQIADTPKVSRRQKKKLADIDARLEELERVTQAGAEQGVLPGMELTSGEAREGLKLLQEEAPEPRLARRRRAEVEEEPQMGLELPIQFGATDKIDRSILQAAGLPLAPRNEAQVSMLDWFDKNVVGKTQEDLLKLKEAKPGLFKGNSIKARVLRELLTPETAAPVETLRPVETTTPTPDLEVPSAEPSVPPQADLAGIEPSVGVSGERGEVPAGEPAAPDAGGVVSPSVPVEPRDVDEGVSPAAVEAPAQPPSAFGRMAETLTTTPEATTAAAPAEQPVGYEGYAPQGREKQLEVLAGDIYAADETKYNPKTGKLQYISFGKADANGPGLGGAAGKKFYESLDAAERLRVEQYVQQKRRMRRAYEQQVRSEMKTGKKPGKGKKPSPAQERQATLEEMEEEAAEQVEQDAEYMEEQKARLAAKKKAEQELKELDKAEAEAKAARKAAQKKPAVKPAVKPAEKPAEKKAEKPAEAAKPAPKKPVKTEARERAEGHADEVGGDVVWEKDDLALIRVESLSGKEPIYIATKGERRTTTDIRRADPAWLKEEKPELLAAVQELEGEAKPAETKPVQTDTPEFKRWFKGSKVVDEIGRPLIVYHGTTQNFTEFKDTGKRASGLWHGAGFYFSKSPFTASDYAGEDLEGANVLPVYLSIKNPFYGELSEKDISTLLKWPRFAAAYKTAKEEVSAADYTPSIERLGVIDGDRDEFIRDALERAGYDGRIIDPEFYRESEYVAFRPEQIKSAISNIGAFDPTNPDIRYAIEPTAAPAIPNNVLTSLEGNDLSTALTRLAGQTENTVRKRIAERLAPLLKDTKVEILDALATPDGAPVLGTATSDGRRIQLSRAGGLNEETLLHEAIHAATERILAMPAAQRTAAQNVAVRQLTQVWNDAREAKLPISKEAKTELSEFVAEAMSNGDLQNALNTRAVGDKSLWTTFKEAVLRLLGMPVTKTQLDEVLDATDAIFAAPEVGVVQTDTAAFKRWFGDSKVVDSTGRPLVVYHGTNADITEFRRTKIGEFGPAIYFASSPSEAGAYADAKRRGQEDGAPNIIPVYLSLQNPYTKGVDAFWKEFGREGETDAQAIERAKVAGYDGVIEQKSDWRDRPFQHYVAFEPTQIKSAISNRGTFDPANPDIRYQINQASKDIIDSMGPAQATGIKKLLQSALPSGGGWTSEATSAVPGMMTRLRTLIPDRAATIEERFAEQFNYGVRDSLGRINPMLKYRQAEDAKKLALQFYQMGILKEDPVTKQYYIESDPDVRAPAEVYRLVEKWGKQNGYDFKEAKRIAGRIIEGARLHELREANRQGANFALHLKDAEIDQLYAEYLADPALQDMQKAMDEPRLRLIDEAVKSGWLSPEQGKAWKEATNYVPFDRLEDLEAAFRKQKRLGRGMAQLGKLPELKGSAVRPVDNVFDNYISTMGWMLDRTVRNSAVVNTLKELEALPTPQAKRIGNPQAARDPARTVTTFIDGQPVAYELPSVYDAYAFNNKVTPLPHLFRWLGHFSNVLRTAVTAMPTFSTRQLVEDSQRAAIHSGVQNVLGVTKKAVSNFAQLSGSAILGKEHPIVKEFGRIGQTGEIDWNDANPAKSLLKDLGYEDRRLLGSKSLGGLLHKLNDISRASDLAVRKAIYDQTLEETNDEILARQRAREIINFRRRGAGDRFGVLDMLIQTVPFFNAYVQGMDVLLRTLSGKGAASGVARDRALKLMYTRAGIATSIGLLYALASSDDDRYTEENLRKRDRMFILGDNFGIPVPTELGVLFKAIPERVMEYYQRYGTAEEQLASEAFKTWAVYAFDEYFGRTVPIPQAFRPALEVLTNHSFSTGRPLKGIFQEGLEPSQQVSSTTSELAKTVANWTKDTVGVQVSPISIDTFLSGYLGTTAMIVTSTLDSVINPSRSERSLSQIVGLAAFAPNPVGTRRVGELYELREQTAKAVNTLNQLMKMDPEKAAKYVEENREKLVLSKAVTSTLEELAKTRQYKRWLETDAAAAQYSAAERRQMREETQLLEQRLAGWVREAKAAYKL